MINQFPQQTLMTLLTGADTDKDQLRVLIDQLVLFTSIIEGSGIPSFKADRHQWYFDLVTSKYYRNADGGTTWVALN